MSAAAVLTDPLSDPIPALHVGPTPIHDELLAEYGPGLDAAHLGAVEALAEVDAAMGVLG